MSYPEAVATVVMSSQKSAPVAVTVISNIAQGTAAIGLLVIPCVIGQIAQIFMGAALSPLFAKRVGALQESTAAVRLEVIMFMCWWRSQPHARPRAAACHMMIVYCAGVLRSWGALGVRFSCLDGLPSVPRVTCMCALYIRGVSATGTYSTLLSK